MSGTTLRRARVAILVCLLLLAGSSAAQAQDAYLFTVDRNISQVTVHPDDRSALIEYWLTFTCAPGAHPIDWVDVGLPHSGYELSEVRAWYRPGTGEDGAFEVALTGLDDSPYVESGVAVPLGDHAIQPGEQGTVYFRATMSYMVHPNYSKTSQASLRFSPTFFGSEFVEGTTYLEVRFLFAPVERMFERAPQVFCIGSMVVAFVVLNGAQKLRQRQRRMNYLAPKMSIEGVGIKRGLTVVEAAVLLETPLDTVLTMILFGVLKKGGVLPGASFASSIVDGVETMAGSIVSRVETFTGGVTARTNPRAVSCSRSSGSSSSRSSGSSRSSFSSGSTRRSSIRSSSSSRSSSCACACACACAGGGR